MNKENLIAADTNDTGAATPEDQQQQPAAEPSTPAEQVLYGNDQDTKPQDEQANQDQEAQQPNGAPEKYDLEIPQGAQVDPEFLTEFESVAREANLNNDQAKKFAALGTKLSEKMTAMQAEAQARQVEQWKSESLSDKEFGGDQLQSNIAIAKTALTQFASPKLVELLNASGLGNHPEVIRAFYKVGKAISPDQGLVKGKETTSKPTAKEVLYGSPRS